MTVPVMCIIALTPAALVSGSARAEEFVRRWIDDSGHHSIEAKFLDSRDGLISLETSSGKHITVPVDRLCAGDQKYVESVLRTADVARLQGSWRAHASQAGGEPAPADVLERLGFEFEGKKVVISGNTEGDEAMPACDYTLNVLRNPREIDIVVGPPDGLVRGIYSFEADELVICFRHGGSKGPRPKTFTTGADPDLIQIRLRNSTQPPR
jgi:uncharacterized protein (TIGR03067 family)